MNGSASGAGARGSGGRFRAPRSWADMHATASRGPPVSRDATAPTGTRARTGSRDATGRMGVTGRMALGSR